MVVVEVVVVEVVVEVVGVCCCLVLVPAAGWLAVSLADLWPKLAASLLLISATAPLSAEADLTVTCLMRPKLVAVGVDLMTLLRILCESCWPETNPTRSRAKVNLKLKLFILIKLILILVGIVF